MVVERTVEGGDSRDSPVPSSKPEDLGAAVCSESPG